MKPHLSLKRKLIWAGIFGIAMGYFEAALVEYLRELYYPDGFAFPLKEIPMNLFFIELGREAASMLMLVSVSALLGCCFIDRFAGFAYIFGIWDITYYLFLKLFEGWPSSLFTVDLLFLIPFPWIGPVWAPVLVSVALIWAAWNIWRKLDQGMILRPTGWDWVLEIIAGLIIIASFLAGGSAVMNKQMPPPFPWFVWLIGMLLGIGIFVRALQRNK
ncbi:MAG: hypothetical protein P9X24_14120 [Candidatus Hatepunaea meridiana]|nr:hypothetical protein [Candidatus Hatepunaea meridiana]